MWRITQRMSLNFAIRGLFKNLKQVLIKKTWAQISGCIGFMCWLQGQLTEWSQQSLLRATHSRTAFLHLSWATRCNVCGSRRRASKIDHIQIYEDVSGPSNIQGMLGLDQPPLALTKHHTIQFSKTTVFTWLLNRMAYFNKKQIKKKPRT